MPSSLNISASKFHAFSTQGNLKEITKILLNHPALMPIYLHFCSISCTLQCLNELCQLTQVDLKMVFEDMVQNSFNNSFPFFITQLHQEQNSPYARPPYSRGGTPLLRLS